MVFVIPIIPIIRFLQIKCLSMMFFLSSCQTDYSCIKHVIKRASLCEQSPARGETCRPGLDHSASYHSYGCCHIQPLVSEDWYV